MSEPTVYSPYTKIYNFWTGSGLEDIPAKIRDYLLVMPCKECPSPITTNDNPRVRLVKYLYHDVAKPLDQAIPTVDERKKMVFDPYNPTTPSTDKGYRVYTQSVVNQAQLTGQTILRIVMGRTIPKDPFTSMIAVDFVVMSNYSLEANTRDTALLRTYAMELAIIEALHGVNIDGIGAFMFDKRSHGDCGSYAITDDQMNVGRCVTMCFESKADQSDFNNG